MEQLPKDFIKFIQEDDFLDNILISTLDSVSPTAIRVHANRNVEFEVEIKPIPWTTNGFWLNERPVFTLDPLFHAGAYYVQEAGSQVLDFVLRNLKLPKNPCILDLCAAPGGKSSLIADFLNQNGFLLSNELIYNRAKILADNMHKWAYQNTFVSSNKPADLGKLNSFFDVIVVDAPCSGEGMFRKDRDARKEWSLQNVAKCAERQRQIIDDVWDSLAEDGFLIYSTCTFNSIENEQNIKWLLEEFSCSLVDIEIPDFKKGREDIGFYGLPYLQDTEGFFIAILQKHSSQGVYKPKKFKTELKQVSAGSELSELFIKNRELIEWNDRLFCSLLPFEKTAILKHELTLLKMGTTLGERAKKGIIPHVGLAFDSRIQASDISKIHVDLNQALLYLKGDVFPLELKDGYHLICYKNQVLGWIKQIGSRFNNLYPKELRIKMALPKTN